MLCAGHGITELTGKHSAKNDTTQLCPQPENRLLLAIRTVEKAMKHLNCSLHNGDVYIKPECSKYTYVFHKNITDFLHQLIGNPQLAEILVGNIKQISSMLSNEHVL